MIGTDGFGVRAGFGNTCALRARTVFSARINGIRTENTVSVNGKDGFLGFVQDHRLRTDGVFIRAQSVIRADGFSSAQVLRKPARCAREPCFPYG